MLLQSIIGNLRKKAFGFTLLELLVVIAIIGILATVIMASINSARDEASNTRTIAQVEEYTKVFDLYFSDNDVYPPNVSGLWDCLGQYESSGVWAQNECWEDAANKVSGTLSSIDSYMPYRPEGHLVSLPSGIVSRGERYSQKCAGDGYWVQYRLIGPNQQCGIGVRDSSAANVTNCSVYGGALTGIGPAPAYASICE